MEPLLESYLTKFNFSKKLIQLINDEGILKKYNSRDIFFNENNTPNYTTLLLEGSLELYMDIKDKKTLLYSFTSQETCIVNFINLFGSFPINFSSLALEKSVLILIPLEKIEIWSQEFPVFREFVIKSHEYHYKSILSSIHFFSDGSIEKRLYDYLKLKAIYKKTNEISIPHQQIANDLNCSRVIITKTIKKLEKDNLLIRNIRSVTLINI